ncbi:D-hexose-6-phosphate mutarotase [Sulfurovum sp. TSL6]|uniref:D-hexose-6-phosphate mutarotase n=1 Tax=Sulfurovum sp. TSL6 TaxID=2826995 RepID=UPI001CC392C2|nr:D-hexose-6-phosphate mutarotase [Sulfurovum sp. TSL6]GIU00155.1 D-hexose-6-phosphate mutarotase [Sulfurovum sp. TSL6]
MYKQDDLEYISVENSSSSAKIALQGAHIFDFILKERGRVLFLSEASEFREGKAIRGGVPICWPWFGANENDSALPNHGFARTSLWAHQSTQTLSDRETKVTLTLHSSPETLVLWPYAFCLTLDIYVGKVLRLELTSQNLDTKAFTFTSALHTYLAIDTIYETRVDGFKAKQYFDKTQNTFAIQEGTIDFSKEVDRIYKNVKNDVVVKDEKVHHTIQTEGTKTIVVWNPGEVLESRMPDLSDHTKMLCVESANVLDDAVTLAKGESHTLRQTIVTEFRDVSISR